MRKFLILMTALGLALGLYFMSGQISKTGGATNLATSADAVEAPEATDTASAERAIRSALQKQARAWNKGDIDAFMESYWKSDALRFASGGSINSGWDVTKARYKSRYPDRAAMGELAFTDLDVRVLAAEHALVFGRWKLTRENDAPGGLFTLHWRKIDGDWQIVSDHTSSGD